MKKIRKFLGIVIITIAVAATVGCHFVQPPASPAPPGLPPLPPPPPIPVP